MSPQASTQLRKMMLRYGIENEQVSTSPYFKSGSNPVDFDLEIENFHMSRQRGFSSKNADASNFVHPRHLAASKPLPKATTIHRSTHHAATRQCKQSAATSHQLVAFHLALQRLTQLLTPHASDVSILEVRMMWRVEFCRTIQTLRWMRCLNL